MIDVIFYYGTEIVMVRIINGEVYFGNSGFGKILVPFQNLNISKEGAIKEFPDLKDRDDWKEETIKRFKEKIKQIKTENEISDYLINDLKKYGYVPKYKQQGGFRPQIIK